MSERGSVGSRMIAAATGVALLCAAGDVRAASPLQVRSGERALVVAPHPDDETLGAGGLIQRVLARGGTVRVVLVTAGDGYVEAVAREAGLASPPPSQYVAYGERRLREAAAAVRELGGGRVGLDVLGFPDGALDPLLHAYWRHGEPERSPTTGATAPPYGHVLVPEIKYHGASLCGALLQVLHEVRPTQVILPDSVDTHPDHRAAGLFTLLAIDAWMSGAPGGEAVMPRLLGYVVHAPWNSPPASAADTNGHGEPARPTSPEQLPWQLTLTEGEIARKRAALAKHESQRDVTGAPLTSYAGPIERFTSVSLDEVRQVASPRGSLTRQCRGDRSALSSARSRPHPSSR